MAGALEPIILTKDELWLLQSVVRHESLDQSRWQIPTTDLDLNEQVARALVFCEDHGQEEAALHLTNSQLILLDAVVPASAKSVAGVSIGRSVLLKSYRARLGLTAPQTPEGADRLVDKSEVMRLLETRKQGDPSDA